MERQTSSAPKQKNWMVNLLIAAVIVLAAANFLKKDSGKKVSEEQLRSDIQVEDLAFAEYDLDIDELTITERKTAEDSSFDMICLSLTASGETLTYSADYDIVYGKYQDGWQLDSLQSDNQKWYAKYDCPDDLVKEAVQKETEAHGRLLSADITNREGDLSYQTVTCYFSLQRDTGTVQEFFAEVKCSFRGGSWFTTSTTIYHADTGEMAYLGWLVE